MSAKAKEVKNDNKQQLELECVDKKENNHQQVKSLGEIRI